MGAKINWTRFAKDLKDEHRRSQKCLDRRAKQQTAENAADFADDPKKVPVAKRPGRKGLVFSDAVRSLWKAALVSGEKVSASQSAIDSACLRYPELEASYTRLIELKGDRRTANKSVYSAIKGCKGK